MILASLGLALVMAAPDSCVAGAALKEGQQRALQRTAMAHVERIRAMGGVKAKAELLCGKWGRVQLVPPAGKADPGWVLLNRAADGWKVVLGPGTSFSAEDLKKVGAPAAIWPPK